MILDSFLDLKWNRYVAMSPLACNHGREGRIRESKQ